MDLQKLNEANKTKEAIEDYKICLDVIIDNMKNYNISPDIKQKVKNLFSSEIERLTIKFEDL